MAPIKVESPPKLAPCGFCGALVPQPTIKEPMTRPRNFCTWAERGLFVDALFASRERERGKK